MHECLLVSFSNQERHGDPLGGCIQFALSMHGDRKLMSVIALEAKEPKSVVRQLLHLHVVLLASGICKGVTKGCASSTLETNRVWMHASANIKGPGVCHKNVPNEAEGTETYQGWHLYCVPHKTDAAASS